MARAVRAHVRGAGFTADDGFAGRPVFQRLARLGIYLGGDGLPDRAQVLPRGRMPARHERGPEARAQLAAAHARAEEAAAVRILLLATDGVGPETVAAVHHDVVGLDARAEELFDDGVHRRPCLDEDEDLARCLERGDEVGHRGGAHQSAGRIPVPGHELLHDGGRPVVDGDAVSVIGHVEREILAHHGEPDQSDVSAGTSGCRHAPHCTSVPLGVPVRVEAGIAASIRRQDSSV